jgi:hypothetical protein
MTTPSTMPGAPGPYMPGPPRLYMPGPSGPYMQTPYGQPPQPPKKRRMWLIVLITLPVMLIRPCNLRRPHRHRWQVHHRGLHRGVALTASRGRHKFHSRPLGETAR